VVVVVMWVGGDVSGWMLRRAIEHVQGDQGQEAEIPALN